MTGAVSPHIEAPATPYETAHSTRRVHLPAKELHTFDLYRSEPAHSGKTDRHRPRVPDGYRVVHEEEAAVVRRVFDLYLSGLGVKAVATLVNDEAVPPPRPTNLRNLRRRS